MTVPSPNFPRHPLAATSVATSTRAWPLRKSARASSLSSAGDKRRDYQWAEQEMESKNGDVMLCSHQTNGPMYKIILDRVRMVRFRVGNSGEVEAITETPKACESWPLETGWLIRTFRGHWCDMGQKLALKEWNGWRLTVDIIVASSNINGKAVAQIPQSRPAVLGPGVHHEVSFRGSSSHFLWLATILLQAPSDLDPQAWCSNFNLAYLCRYISHSRSPNLDPDSLNTSNPHTSAINTWGRGKEKPASSLSLFFTHGLFTHRCFDHCHRTLIAPYESVHKFILDPKAWNFKKA